jgi:hypothetical protein
LFPAVALAQDEETSPWFVRAGFTPAYIVSGNPFSTSASNPNDVLHWTPNVTIEAGRQVDGTEKWHHVYGMPSFGFGLSFLSINSAAATSHPVEASTFFSWPFAPLTDRLALTTDFGMGLSWGWKTLNTATGAYQNVLGSNLNARVDWGFYLRYRATSRIASYAGIDFTHRSNAGMVQPDIGINMIGPKVAVEYAFGSEHIPRGPVNPPPFRPAWEFVVGGSGGVKNVIERSSPMARADFGTANLTTAVQRQFYRFGKVAAGADVTYDGSTGVRLDGDDRQWRVPASDRWSVGIYGGYEHVIGRFGALVQAGGVVPTATATDVRRLYSRFGWRYHVNDRVWTALAIRAYGFRNANALEIGAGYRFGRQTIPP